MKTVIDAKEWILELLNTNKPTISGKLYIDKRPSVDKEDIVINSITMTGKTMQNGVFNVNCYVPNLSVKVDGITTSVPNRTRLKVIASQVSTILTERYKKQHYNLTIENHEQIEEETENSTYINFRITLNAFN